MKVTIRIATVGASAVGAKATNSGCAWCLAKRWQEIGNDFDQAIADGDTNCRDSGYECACAAAGTCRERLAY